MGRRNTTTTLEDVDRLLESGFAEYYTDPSGALRSAEEALKILGRVDESYRRGRIAMLAASALEFLSRSEEAIERGEEAITRFRASKSPLNEANALNMIGVSCRSLSRYSDSMESFRKAHSIFTRLDDPERSAAARNNIGSVYEMLGDFENALQEYLAALAYYREIGHRKYEGLVSGNIGNIYHAMEDLEKAIEWHSRALVISQEEDDLIGEATLRLNLSSSYRNSEEPDRALQTLGPALDIVRSVGQRRLEGAILEMLGTIHMQMGKTQDALPLLREASTILLEVSAEREYTSALEKISRALHEEGKSDEALGIIENAIEIIEKVGDRKAMINMLELLAEIRESLGDLAGALEAQRRTYALYAEVKGEEREQGITKLRARFDVAEKERERLEYERRAVEQTELAEERSREINSTAMLLIKKNSLLQQIRNDLQEYRKKEDDTKLTRIFSRIDEGLRSDDDWQRFEETYRLVHHDFITRLSTRFPELSPTELKVAALLHIDLSNKEIADLLCISLRTIESHRYNIRKKLGLPGSANLAIQIGQRVADDATG